MSRNVVETYDTWGANGNGTFAYDSKVATDLPYVKSVTKQKQQVCLPTFCFLHVLFAALFCVFTYISL